MKLVARMLLLLQSITDQFSSTKSMMGVALPLLLIDVTRVHLVGVAWCMLLMTRPQLDRTTPKIVSTPRRKLLEVHAVRGTSR